MLLLQQMIALFLFMMIGYFMSRKGILDRKGEKTLSWLILNVANPSMILSGSISEQNHLSAEELGTTLLIAVIMYVLLIPAGIAVTKCFRAPKQREGIYHLMFIFSNIGFMGFPLANAMYGPTAVVLASIFTIPFNILIYTYGMTVVEKSAAVADAIEEGAKEQSAGSVLKKLINPGTVCCALAVVFTLIHPVMPTFVHTTVTNLANLTAALSMMVIGASLTAFPLKELITDHRLILYTLVRLIVVPVAGVSFAKLFLHSDMMLGILFIMLATPVASMVAMFAQQADGDYEFAARGVALSTVLSVITMPVVSMLLGL